MSFATFASLDFTARGESWTADIELWNGTSASNTFQLLSGSRRVGDPRMNPLNPFLASVLHTKIFDKDRLIHDKILNNDLSDIRITIKKGGTIWHRGVLTDVRGGEAIRMDSPELRLVWSSGLPCLKESALDEQGRDTLLEGCFQFVDTCSMDLPLRMAIAWAHGDTNTSNRRRSTSWQIQYEHQLRNGSKWEALSQLLREYNMQILQEDGKWRALHRSYRTGTYDWEQRETGGSTSTGSRDPLVTLTDSDWRSKNDNEPVRRETVRATSWEQTYELGGTDWLNDDFTSASTDIDGNTVPEGWRLHGSLTTFDEANDDVEVFSGEGIDTSDPAFVEQIWSKVIVEDSVDNTADSFTLRVKGEIDINDTNETGTVTVPVAEVAAKVADPDSVVYGNEAANWTSSKQYVKTTVNESDSGTATRTFDTSVTFDAPSLSAGVNETYIRLRLVTQADPDGDGNNEVNSTRFQIANIRTLRRKTAQEHRPADRATYSYVSAGGNQSERSRIGPAKQPSQLEPETSNPHCGLRYYDSGNGRFELLDEEAVSHATLSISDALDVVRLEDKYAQQSTKLFRIRGILPTSALNARDTAKYAGRKWVPTYIKEWIRKENMEVALTELRTDSVPADLVSTSTE